MRTAILHTSLIAVPLLWFGGCSGTSALDASNAGKTTTYVSGTPWFDIECMPVTADSLTAFDMYMSVPYPSLIFEKVAEGFRARYDISVRISDRLTGATAREISWPETTLVERYQTTQSFEPIVLHSRLAVPPGAYRVDVTLEDVVSGKHARTAQGVTVHDPADRSPSIGHITLLTEGEKGVRTLQISFYVKEQKDSLTCDVETYNLPAVHAGSVSLSVIRVPADTSIAQPPYWFTVLPLPLGHGLINFSRGDTMSKAVAALSEGRRTQPLEYRIPPLRRGIYRFVAEASGKGVTGEDTVVSSSRFFSVRGPGFPRPVTYAELLAAATYLATQQEINAFREVRTPAEQRKAFEAFWLTCAGDQEKASALIKRYYARVEEANRMFTTTREGWRTDRGLLYCVLGPPSSITNQMDQQTWYYDLTGNAADNTYFFKRIIREGDGLTIEDYVLYRQSAYESFWTRMIARWRSGDPM